MPAPSIPAAAEIEAYSLVAAGNGMAGFIGAYFVAVAGCYILLGSNA